MNILIAGGGTGGHLFPGIAVAQQLRARNAEHRIMFVGTARGIEVDAVPKAGFDLQLLPVSGLRQQGITGTLRGLMRLPGAMVQALVLLWRFRPDVAVSVGGYAAGPAVLAARLICVPCVVMEQNAVPGLTNRLLAKLAARVVAGMPVQGLPQKKVQVLGNPVRESLHAVRAREYHQHMPFRILVFGGSQGAVALNTAIVDMVQAAKSEGVNFDLRHQVGRRNLATVEAAYIENTSDDTENRSRTVSTVTVQVHDFIDDMAEAYAWADLVICRAGATSLAELTVCGRPAILVPFPFAVDDHQTKNAHSLVAEGAALHIPETELSGVVLLALVRELMTDGARLEAMAAASKQAGRPDAAAKIADVIAEVAHV